MDYLFGVLQGFVVIAIVWVKIGSLEKRFDRLEKRVDHWLNGRSN